MRYLSLASLSVQVHDLYGKGSASNAFLFSYRTPHEPGGGAEPRGGGDPQAGLTYVSDALSRRLGERLRAECAARGPRDPMALRQALLAQMECLYPSRESGVDGFVADVIDAFRPLATPYDLPLLDRLARPRAAPAKRGLASCPFLGGSSPAPRRSHLA